MKTLMATLLLVLTALMTEQGLTAPISCYDSSTTNSTDPGNATPDNSTDTNATAVSANIPALQDKAKREVFSVYQEIRELEIYYVRY